MVMFKKYHNKLFCFSPPVMLATFLLEFSFAFYTYWRYKISTVSRLAIIMLTALGIFQLSEYMLCGGLELNGIEWVRLGYGAIALLPALGTHMIVALAGKKRPVLTSAAYASCAIFTGFYLMAADSVSLHTCYSNYAVFSSSAAIAWPFAIYYYGWLLIGVYLAWHWAEHVPRRRKALNFMITGYLAFILPTTAFNLVNPSTIRGIPSIMCGFAVLFAIILVVGILPNSCKFYTHRQSIFRNLRVKI
jgi:hypothetical protein